MSYYKPSFSQAVAMTRGRGFSMSYRGGSNRSSWGGSDRSRSGYGSRGGPGGGGGGGRFSQTFSNSFEFRPSDRYSGSRHEDYHKSYRMDPSANYSNRDHRSPERKRMRQETSSSHRSHEGFGGGDGYGGIRRPGGGYPERRSFSRERDRHVGGSFSHRDTFRKPLAPGSSPRGSYRGGGGDRISSRGSRGSRMRGGPRSRRILDSGGGYGGGLRRRLTRSSEIARKIRINKIRRIKAIARRRARENHIESKDDEEIDIKKEKTDDEKSENEDNDKTTTSSLKSPKKEDVKIEKDKKTENGGSDGEDKATSQSSSRRRDFIKLVCPCCNIRCITFGKYTMHLSSSKHTLAMRRVANKQKSILSRMRLAQRNTQRELEKNSEDLAPRTNFCPLCKLNYKQPKATHQASDSHKSMKKFLMPYCKTCHITFKSPISFETHLCSIEHIKRKARTAVNGDKSGGESENEDDLENFMTIDSVGELDEEAPEEKKTTETEGKPKEKINVGIEHITKVEVYYCELCKMYLPRVTEGELDPTFSKHCRQRIHMQKYIRYKEDKEIQSRAEKLQRKETAEKENREKKDKDGEDEEDTAADKSSSELKTVKEEEKKHKDNSLAEEEEGDDKLWADVDKDLGDILREAESGNKSSDEEDDANGRYDRFKYSEKNGDDGSKKETTTEGETVKQTEEDEIKEESENNEK